MKLLIILIMIAMHEMAIAAGTLNPVPVPSEPCRTISTPHGDMCAPKAI